MGRQMDGRSPISQTVETIMITKNTKEIKRKRKHANAGDSSGTITGLMTPHGVTARTHAVERVNCARK